MPLSLLPHLFEDLAGAWRLWLIFLSEFVKEKPIFVQMVHDRLADEAFDFHVHRELLAEHDVEPTFHLLNPHFDLVIGIRRIPDLGNVFGFAVAFLMQLVIFDCVLLDLIQAGAGWRSELLNLALCVVDQVLFYLEFTSLFSLLEDFVELGQDFATRAMRAFLQRHFHYK